MKNPIAIAGSVLITAGCFFPVMQVMDKTLTFFDKVPANVPDVPQNAMIYAAIAFITIAVTVTALSLMGRSRFIWLAGILSGLCLGAVYKGMQMKIAEMKTQADEQVSNLFGGLFKGLTNKIFDAVEIGGSGWYIIAAGSLLILISSFVKTPIKTTPTNQ